MIAMACALSFWLLHKTVWMWWILVIFGGLASAVVVIHHLYMATVMVVYVHLALNEVVVAYNRSRPSRIKGALHALMKLTHEASAKIHEEALRLHHESHKISAPWRTPLLPREYLKTTPFGTVPTKVTSHRGTLSVLGGFL